MPAFACELCDSPGGELVWSHPYYRVISVDDHRFPGYVRVIWNAHVAEMSDLQPTDRSLLMNVVLEVESAVREVTMADKINLASFGNVVPHLHWHVIPRWQDDTHFPQPIWGSQQRNGALRTVDQVALAADICGRLAVFR